MLYLRTIPLNIVRNIAGFSLPVQLAAGKQDIKGQINFPDAKTLEFQEHRLLHHHAYQQQI